MLSHLASTPALAARPEPHRPTPAGTPPVTAPQAPARSLDPITRPETFRNACILQQSTPYRTSAPPSSAPHTYGLLDRGRVLWLPCDSGTVTAFITAFAHGIGLLEIERKLLPAIH